MKTVSTEIQDIEEIKERFDLLKTNHRVIKGDLYAMIISDTEGTIQTFGKAIEWKVENLGSRNRLKRVDKNTELLKSRQLKHKESMETFESKLEDFQSRLEEIENSTTSDIIKEYQKNRIAESDQKQISVREMFKNRKRDEEIEYSKIIIELEETTALMKLEIEDFKKSELIINEALERDLRDIDLIHRRLQYWYSESYLVETQLEQLENGELDDLQINVNAISINGLTQSDLDLIQDSEDKEKIVEAIRNHELNIKESLNSKFTVFEKIFQKIRESNVSDDLKRYIKRRNLESWKRTIDVMIENLETEVNAIGTVTRRNYVQRTMTDNGLSKEGDLIAFSRTFDNSKTQITSEMTYDIRSSVDNVEAFRPMKILNTILGVIVVILLGITILDAEIDIINVHTSYWFLGIFISFWMMIRYMQNDRIFQAFYHYFDTREVFIPYFDEEGNLFTMKMKCYDLELTISEISDFTKQLMQTPDDLQRNMDSRLMSTIIDLQHKETIYRLDEVANTKHISHLKNANQGLVYKFKDIMSDAVATLKRQLQTMSIGQPIEPDKTKSNIASLFGLSAVILSVGFVLMQIFPEVVFVGDSESNNSYAWVYFFVGVAIGLMIAILPQRWSRKF